MIRNHMIENAEALRSAAFRRRENAAAGGCVMAVNKAAERERVSLMTEQEVFEARIASFWHEVRSFKRELQNCLAAGLTVDECEIPF